MKLHSCCKWQIFENVSYNMWLLLIITITFLSRTIFVTTVQYSDWSFYSHWTKLSNGVLEQFELLPTWINQIKHNQVINIFG